MSPPLRKQSTDQWVVRAKRRLQGRLAGRIESALDILDRTDIPRSRKKVARLKYRAVVALEQALRSFR